MTKAFIGINNVTKGPVPKPIEELFWPKVNKFGGIVREELGNCWEWGSKPSAAGYGILSGAYAHRVSWELASGNKLTKSVKILHICDIRKCVRNDDHGVYKYNGIEYERYGHLFLCTGRIVLPDIVGHRFNSWTVIEYFGYINNGRESEIKAWLCECDCGFTKPIAHYNLVNNRTSKCTACSGRDKRKFNNNGKYCSICKYFLPFDEFTSSPREASGRYSSCKVCSKLNRYNIFKEYYDTMLISQNYKCAISGCENIPNEEEYYV